MPPVDQTVFVDLLAVGTAGLVLGVGLPFIFRMIGFLVDAVRLILE